MRMPAAARTRLLPVLGSTRRANANSTESHAIRSTWLILSPREPPTRALGPARPSRNGHRRLDSDTGRYRRLSPNQKDVNIAHARQRGPGERVNAELKNWRILRKIRSCPR
jgi:hypothetical protein